MIINLTKDQAVDRLMHSDRDSLAERAYYSHKDFYGTKGHHMMNYTKEELVSWILSHFDWNEDQQIWENKVPFEGEDRDDSIEDDYLNELADEQEYYSQFG